MTNSTDIAPTKTHRGENFPVASLLIAPRHRATILAFYRFARAADDIADHPTLAAHDKLARLDLLEHALLGKTDAAVDALPLRQALGENNLPARHAQDLLTAFRMDVTKLRYDTFDELMGYCTFSAMPVGRFVLDVHSEARSTWPASDALCSALQIINHLQDCGKARHGMRVEELRAERASPALRACVGELAGRTSGLLHQAAPFGMLVEDLRLALEVSVIQKLAVTLVALLMRRDPLCERVHLSSVQAAMHAAGTIAAVLPRRLIRPSARPNRDARASGP